LLRSGVVASHVLVQERLLGQWHESFSFGCHPYADSRARLTEDRRMHSSGCGGVPSPRASVVSGMVLQCLGWWNSGGDGSTGPEVAEETHSTSPTSRRRPGRACGRRSYPFRGFCRPLLRGTMWWRYGSGQHSVTKLTLAFPHSARDGCTGLVSGTAPRYDSHVVSEGQRGEDSPLNQAPAACQSI
jgi:hypothetical protein